MFIEIDMGKEHPSHLGANHRLNCGTFAIHIVTNTSYTTY